MIQDTIFQERRQAWRLEFDEIQDTIKYYIYYVLWRDQKGQLTKSSKSWFFLSYSYLDVT